MAHDGLAVSAATLRILEKLDAGEEVVFGSTFLPRFLQEVGRTNGTRRIDCRIETGCAHLKLVNYMLTNCTTSPPSRS